MMTSFVATTLMVATTPALAQSSNANDRARAQTLFDSALADVEAGHFANACPKFAASQEADPKTSTLLNLGACYEKIGRTASAWGAFREAQGLARRSARADLEAAARARADALAPSLVRLAIEVPASSRVPGLVVSRDGSHLASAEWGVRIPVDSGDHWISAEAPGKVPWRKRITIGDEDQSMEIPALEDAVTEGRSFPVIVEGSATEPSPTWWTPARTTGVVLGGVGVTSIVTGFVLAFVAKGNYDDARDTCSLGAGCSATAVARADDARSLATGGTVAIVAGSAFAVVGASLVLFAERGADPQAQGRGASARVGMLGLQSVGVSGRW